MNLLTFISFLILAISILTIVFVAISYFMYKSKENQEQGRVTTYQDELKKQQKELLFFEEIDTSN